MNTVVNRFKKISEDRIVNTIRKAPKMLADKVSKAFEPAFAPKAFAFAV